ncbi:hypothetical protein LJR267_010482 [Paraburkholderia hospita]|jgi:hypothetical protein|uniref:hypothetical protein n=1 Tax=Paraburkholderia hospita TaxID=169430 RepID=UPI003ECDF783
MKVTRFTTINGQNVIMVVTDSGVTGYVDATIPLEALEAWRRRLSAELKRPISRLHRNARQPSRRRLIRVRPRIRRPRSHKRMNVYVRRTRLVRRR